MTKFVNSYDASKLYTKSAVANMEGHAVVQVTPELAKAWLELHISNRPLSMTKVRWYAEQMQKGEWKLSGQGLIFSDTGIGLDGQHRLKAIILSGCIIDIDVRFGIPENVFAVLDAGAARTGGDALAIEGIKHYNISAAIARNAMGFEKYGKATNYAGDSRPTNASILQYVIENRCIEDFAGLAHKYSQMSGGILTPSMIGTVHYLASKVETKKADQFVYKLCTGAELSTSDPIFLLRTRLMKAKLDKSTSLNKKTSFALIIKAWRLFLEGKTIKQLKFDHERENFPSFSIS